MLLVNSRVDIESPCITSLSILKIGALHYEPLLSSTCLKVCTLIFSIALTFKAPAIERVQMEYPIAF